MPVIFHSDQRHKVLKVMKLTVIHERQHRKTVDGGHIMVNVSLLFGGSLKTSPQRQSGYFFSELKTVRLLCKVLFSAL